jgi:hypothetical protein
MWLYYVEDYNFVRYSKRKKDNTLIFLQTSKINKEDSFELTQWCQTEKATGTVLPFAISLPSLVIQTMMCKETFIIAP